MHPLRKSLHARIFSSQCKHYAIASCNAGGVIYNYNSRLWIRQCRQFSSSHSKESVAMNPEIRYAKALLKLFLFQVHPDYFVNHKKEQEVNESNIQSITERLSSSTFQLQNDVRTLTFYLKPQHERQQGDQVLEGIDNQVLDGMDNQQIYKPKRIKIAVTTLHRLIDSIKNVLESIGVTQLPEKPRNFGFETKNRIFVNKQRSGQHYEVQDFFESLIDQRELINLRKDTAKYSKQLLSMVQIKLGVDKISMQSNLSSVNAYALIKALLNVIDVNSKKLILPWKGLELVISGNDIPVASVDAIEGTVSINPTQTPNQWLLAFFSVNNDTFRIAYEYKKRIELLSQNASKIIRELITDNIETNSSRVHKNVRYSWKNTNDDIVIRLRKGYTCSNHLFLKFLETHFPLSNQSTSVVLSLNNNDDDDDDDDPDHRSDDDDDDDVNDDNIHVNYGNVNREKEESTAITKQAMMIEVLIEHGYGTKVLDNGEVRLDANISTKVLTEFITNHTAKIITHTVRNIRRRNELELLRQRVLTEVGISTLSRGVGITEDMFEEFLRMMVNNNDSNDNKDTNYMHRKKIMENLDVRVSKYFGVSDDGYILVPWDVELKN